MTPTYNVTYKEIENYIKKGYIKGRKDAIKQASDFSLAAPMLVLKDEFGFGEKRLLRFYEAVLELYDSVDKGYLNLSDIVKTIEEENNIKIATRRKK